MKYCIHYVVSGRVQGVWYRASTKAKAIDLGLTGWVRNRDDGAVELVACGEESQLQLLQDWLWQGPPLAKVTEVTIAKQPWQQFDEFEVW